MTRLAATLLCLALAGCGASPAEEAPQVDPGIEFTLAPGQSMSVRSARVTVRFVTVTEDTRCPIDTNCIWAGEVKVRLEIAHDSQVTQVEVLEGANAPAGEYRATVVRVEPKPVSTKRIAPQDYRATLKIDRASQALTIFAPAGTGSAGPARVRRCPAG